MGLNGIEYTVTYGENIHPSPAAQGPPVQPSGDLSSKSGYWPLDPQAWGAVYVPKALPGSDTQREGQCLT